MINLEEKIDLAKELKLKKQISLLEYKKGMFDLKFKEISMKDIIRRLTFYRFKPRKTPSICAFMMVLFGIGFSRIFVPSFLWWPWIFSLLPIVIWLCDSLHKTNILDCWVDDFKYEIPYGALLALKEASEKGILHHKIFYPVWHNLFKDALESLGLILDDPIIVGTDIRGDMFEIYSWNENDVYGD